MSVASTYDVIKINLTCYFHTRRFYVNLATQTKFTNGYENAFFMNEVFARTAVRQARSRLAWG